MTPRARVSAERSAEIVRQYGQTWEADFRLHAEALGLTVTHVSRDPLYGWLVALDDGREVEAETTAGVRRGLDRLARVKP